MKLLFKNTTILITGASSGMGKELARSLAGEAKTLILVARRENELDALAVELRASSPEPGVYPIPCDLTDLNAVTALTSKIRDEIGDVDILINAAGVGQISFLENAPLDEIERMIQLNVLGLTHLCHAFLPGMIERGSGGILNFSSFFGLKILPGYAAYAGTKHYVTGFTEALCAEVAGTGVVVSGVYPGPVKSAFWDTPNTELLGPPSFLFISVEQCVRKTLKGFRKGRARIVPGIRINLLLTFLAISPAPVVRLVNAGIARMKRVKNKKMVSALSVQAKTGNNPIN